MEHVFSFSDRLAVFRSMPPDLWMFEYMYNLRRGRQFDKADKLEGLLTMLKSGTPVWIFLLLPERSFEMLMLIILVCYSIVPDI
jgi:hypothetical protein